VIIGQIKSRAKRTGFFITVTPLEIKYFAYGLTQLGRWASHPAAEKEKYLARDWSFWYSPASLIRQFFISARSMLIRISPHIKNTSNNRVKKTNRWITESRTWLCYNRFYWIMHRCG
jgi:hypothetical protein